MIDKMKLITSDGHVFTVTLEQIRCSRLISGMFQLPGASPTDEPLSLGKIDKNIFEKILKWSEHHKNDVMPENDEPFEFKLDSNMGEWDNQFLTTNHNNLLDILIAANYLDIPILVDNCCKIMANDIKGKTTEELRTLFGIECDFTPEEEELLKRENEWIEDYSACEYSPLPNFRSR